MSTADSGRGSHDGDSSEQTTGKAPAAGGIRTGDLNPGSYYQQPGQNISNMFKRDVLYRSKEDTAPPRPPRACESLYAKPLPCRQSSQETCPVHSARDFSGDFPSNESEFSSYSPSNQLPTVPPRKYKDDIVLTGVIDSEIHV